MNTTASVWSRLEPPQARRFRATLTETQAAIERCLNWGYGGQITVESYELVEDAHRYASSSGVWATRPARYRAVFVADFPAHAQSENAATALCGLIRGLGGTVEEL